MPHAIIRRLLSTQRTLRARIVVLEARCAMLPTALVTTGGKPQSCAVRFGKCRIAAVQVYEELFA